MSKITKYILAKLNFRFRDYDYKRIYHHMSKPAFLFDGRRILDVLKLQQVGFEVYTIGQHN